MNVKRIVKQVFARVLTPPWKTFDATDQLSLRTQLLAGIGRITIAVLLGTSLLLALVVHRSELANWRARQITMAQNTSSRVAAFLQQQENALLLLAYLGGDELQTGEENLEKSFASFPALMEVLFVDPSGRVVAQTARGSAVLAHQFTIRQSRWFEEALAGYRYSSGVQISPEDEPYLILALPALEGGVVAARLDLRLLWQVVSDFRFMDGGQTYLVDRQGQVIAHPDLAFVMARKDITELSTLNNLLQVASPVWYAKTTNLQGVGVMGAVAPVEGAEWLVISEVPVWQVYQTGTLALLLLLAGSLFIYFLVFRLINRLLDRLVLQPMYRLQLGARQIGQGNLAYRVNIARKDELGLVAETFNQMAASLSERERQIVAQTAELNELNEQLEERVQERTAQLSESNANLLCEVAEREEAEQRLQRKTYQQERLIGTAQQLAASLDLHEVLGLIGQGAKEILEAHGCTIYLLERDGRTLTPVVAIDPEYAEEILSSVIDVDNSLNGRAIQAGRGLVFNTPLGSAASFQIPGTPVDQDERLIVAPLVAGDQILGTLCLNRFGENFLDEDLALAETFAAYASAVLKNAQVHHQLQREVEERQRAETALGHRVEIETLVSSLSTRLINVDSEGLDTEIKHILQVIGAFTGVDRAYIFLFNEDGSTMSNTHEWCSEGIEPHIDSLKNISCTIFPWLMEKIVQFKMVYIPRLDDLPADAVAEKNYLQDHHIQSLVAVPLVYGKALAGFLGFSSVRSEKTWSEWDLALLRMVGEILASAIEHERVEQALRKSEERYTLAIRGANDGLWDWNLKKNSIYFSPRWKSMLGYSEQEIGTSPDEWLGRVHPEDLDQVKVDLSTHLQGLTPHFESEHRMQHKDGSYRWVLCRGLAVRPITVSASGPELGSPYRMAGSQTDITERKQAEEQIQHDAFHDALTGLPNRALFLERLSRAIERSSRRPDHPFAVLFLDLDRFKVINDSLGHFIGDQLLIAISSRLSGCLRSVDTAARLGGDEFVILLEDLLDTDAIQVAERIRQELNQPFNLDGHEAVTTASIGIVTGIGYDRPADVLRDADIALYRAKALGKNRYVVFDTSLRTRAMARLELESELRAALERGEFELYYQPIQSLNSDRIIGFEALLRWRSPRRGMILPVEFIPVAEETGLIVPIGEWVLGEACRQAHKWQEQFPMDPPLAINVNISGIQFAHPLLLEQVAQSLKESALPPNNLRLEITESVIMENAEQAQNVLLKLRDLGVQLQIDDFGTGYSSLAYLQRFPIHTIKIDRSFVSRIGANNESGNASEIVKTIVNLAHDLNMDSVAEGVETEEQLARLKDLNCQYGQGFFIARPLEASAAEALLAGAVLHESSGSRRKRSSE